MISLPCLHMTRGPPTGKEATLAEPRLTTEFQVQALLRTAMRAGQFGAVLRRGDAQAGGLLLQLRGRAGFSVLSRIVAEGGPAWLRATGADPVDEATADAYVAREIRRDPDLWVVEIETADLSPPLSDRIVLL